MLEPLILGIKDEEYPDISFTIHDTVESFACWANNKAFHTALAPILEYMQEDMEQIVPFIEQELRDNFKRDFRAFLKEWSQRC